MLLVHDLFKGAIASGSEDCTARIWDILSGKQMHEFKCGNGSVSSVLFSPSGKQLLIGSLGLLRMHDIQEGSILHEFTLADSWINSMVYEPKGKKILIAAIGNRIHLFSENLKEHTIWPSDHQGTISQIAFCPNGKYLASGSRADTTIYMYDGLFGGPLKPLAYNHPILSLAFSPDNIHLASGVYSYGEKSLQITNILTGKLIYAPVDQKMIVNSVSFGDEGRCLVAGTSKGDLLIWHNICIDSEEVLSAIDQITDYQEFKLMLLGFQGLRDNKPFPVLQDDLVFQALIKRCPSLDNKLLFTAIPTIVAASSSCAKPDDERYICSQCEDVKMPNLFYSYNSRLSP